jgi:hypothetical protein
VKVVPALPAFLAGICLFLIPGLTLLALLRREDREAFPLDETLFLAVGASVLASAWVGLVLAELGVFSLVTAALVLVGVSGAAALIGRRRLAWPMRAPPSVAAIAPAGLVLVLAFSLQARPSEYLVGGRDPGAYVAAMGVIGRTGAIVHADPVVTSIPPEDRELFYRHPESGRFSWARFMGFDLESPQSGRVYPQFFHLFPAFGAYLFQAMGVKGALATPPVFGILGTLAVFFTLRRLFGGTAALLGALLLGVNVIQVWFARYPVSETFSQFLIFLGLLAFLHWHERGGPALGILAGAALGVSLLVRIDSLLIAVPLALYVLVRRGREATPWRVLAPFLIPFVLLTVHAAAHAAVFSRKYVLDIASRLYWSHPPAVWIAALVVGIAALATAHRWGPRLGRWLAARRDRLVPAVMALIVAAALYAYFLRPLLSAWAGGDGNDPSAAIPGAVLLHRLGFRRLAAHDAQSFLRLGWFVSPLGLALGVLGLLVAIKEWRPRYLFPLLTGLVFAAFYFYKIRVYNDYFFALRRFVPVVLPFLIGLAALALVRLARSGAGRRALAGGLILALGWQYVAYTGKIAGHVDWRNAVNFVRDLARRFSPDDVVIFEQPQSVHLLSLPVWAHFGVNALELARFDPDPERLGHLIRAWRGRYRTIYFVHTYRTNLCGVFLQRVEEHGFGTREWERTYREPPGRPVDQALHYVVSRVLLPEELPVPPLAEVDVGGADDLQVSGFYGKEGGGSLTYRWTGPCASVYLPGARPGAGVGIWAGVGQRPRSIPAEVKASFAGASLGSFVVGAEWREHVLQLPSPLPPGTPLLRLDVTAWRPAHHLPGSTDTRDLGVMVDRIRLNRAAVLESRVRADSGGRR